MSSVVGNDGRARQLDRPTEPGEQFTAELAADPRRLSEVIMRLLRDVATLKRRWWPEQVDFRDRVVDATGTTLYRLSHGLGGRVNYWIVRWSGAAAPNLVWNAASDDATLVLTSTSAGTATIRVELAG
jgi:hypothetical protein